MKVGLLAPEYSGKTSYLVALYAVLVQDLSNETGYPFRYSIDDPAQRRWLNDQFGYLVDESLPLHVKDSGPSRFPVKTSDEVTDYSISVAEKATSHVERVSLIDFPGEVIRGVSSASSPLYARTMSALASCDAFVVLLDATYLLGTSKYTAKHRISPSDIEDVIRKAIGAVTAKGSTNIGVPVAFCVSKTDKIAKLYAGDQSAREGTLKRVLELFPSFFEAQHRHPVMISCVSLGENIEEPPDHKEGMGGPFEPLFIEKPFEFCVAFGALTSLTNKAHDGNQWRDLARNEDAKAGRARDMGLLGSIGEWFSTGAKFGEWPDDYWERQRNLSQQIAQDRFDEANKYKRVVALFLDRLRKPATADQFTIYYGGKRQVIDGDIVPGVMPLSPAG